MDDYESPVKAAPSERIIHPLVIAVGFLLIFVLYHFFAAVYSLFFSPLSRIPGPWYLAVSRIPYICALTKGTTYIMLRDLHDKYGDVVRYSPNEISFISGETAWQDIYGFRTGKHRGAANFEKDPVWYAPGVDNVDSMLRAQGGNHGRHRKILTHAFSVQALKEQERLIIGYADLLVTRLRDVAESGSVADLVKFYNWTTFDIISDLMFGEPFGCLADLATKPYVEMIIKSVVGFRLYYVLNYWPWVKNLGSLIVNKKQLDARLELLQWVKKQTRKRMDAETDRADFMSQILKHRNDHGEKQTISDSEVISNAQLMLAAGTETSATVLSVATYMLLKNPDKLAKLNAEIRSAFKSQAEITIDAANNLPYLAACMNETMRYRPPIPLGFPRKVPECGAEVSGHFIPGGYNLSASISQYCAYRSPRNFKDPHSFVPERWLGDGEYADDNRAVFQPFSFGPRNCIGKNLAYTEMRVIMARMIFNFDFELQKNSQDWDKDMKVMVLWMRPELNVKLRQVERAET